MNDDKPRSLGGQHTYFPLAALIRLGGEERRAIPESPATA